MLNCKEDYVMMEPFGIVKGDILPTRGNGDCFVRAEDLFFLKEAIQERNFEIPNANLSRRMGPILKSEEEYTNGLEGYSPKDLAVQVRTFFNLTNDAVLGFPNSGMCRYVDATDDDIEAYRTKCEQENIQTFDLTAFRTYISETDAQRTGDKKSLPATFVVTGRILEKYPERIFKKAELVRRMFYDIQRLTRVRVPFQAPSQFEEENRTYFGENDTVYRFETRLVSSPSWDDNDERTSQTLAHDAESIPVQISETVIPQVLRESPKFRVTGGCAIFSWAMQGNANPDPWTNPDKNGGYTYGDASLSRWTCVPFDGNSIVPTESVSSHALEEWMQAEGMSDENRKHHSWSGSITLRDVLFDVQFPAEINSLGWTWKPSRWMDDVNDLREMLAREKGVSNG